MIVWRYAQDLKKSQKHELLTDGHMKNEVKKGDKIKVNGGKSNDGTDRRRSVIEKVKMKKFCEK